MRRLLNLPEHLLRERQSWFQLRTKSSAVALSQEALLITTIRDQARLDLPLHLYILEWLVMGRLRRKSHSWIETMTMMMMKKISLSFVHYFDPIRVQSHSLLLLTTMTMMQQRAMSLLEMTQ